MSRPKPKRRAFLSRSMNDSGHVYWSIRESAKPRQRQLVRLGRCPRDPKERRRFLLRVRLALLRYGVVDAIKKGIKATKPLPEQTMRNRYAPPPGLSSVGGDSSRCPTADKQGFGSSRVDRDDKTGWARFGNPRK